MTTSACIYCGHPEELNSEGYLTCTACARPFYVISRAKERERLAREKAERESQQSLEYAE